jgi:molecular chaperone Hsp33
LDELHDELVRTLSTDGVVSVRVLAATNLVRDAAARHNTSPTATVALGRALMGTLLLATGTQDDERVQLRLMGDGPLGSILVDANSNGAVRGYVQHPSANPPLEGESLGVAAAIGLGSMSVERNHPSWKRPYSGIVPLASGEIAQDLALYLLESEQKPSAVALGVYLSAEGQVEAAGGYLIQSLPGAPEEALVLFEERVADTSNPSVLLRDGASAGALLDRLLAGPGRGEIERIEPGFRCPCGPDRVMRAALLLGRDELREVIASGENLEVRCAFCAEVYRLTPDEIGSSMLDA